MGWIGGIPFFHGQEFTVSRWQPVFFTRPHFTVYGHVYFHLAAVSKSTSAWNRIVWKKPLITTYLRQLPYTVNIHQDATADLLFKCRGWVYAGIRVRLLESVVPFLSRLRRNETCSVCKQHQQKIQWVAYTFILRIRYIPPLLFVLSTLILSCFCCCLLFMICLHCFQWFIGLKKSKLSRDRGRYSFACCSLFTTLKHQTLLKEKILATATVPQHWCLPYTIHDYSCTQFTGKIN